MDQYIGPNQVMGLVKQDFKTPAGSDVIEVQYKGEHTPELMSQMAFDFLVTETPTDYNDLRDRKFRKMVPQIIAIITEWDLKAIELKAFLGTIGDSLQDAMEKASNYLWTHDTRTWVPGMSFMNERTLLEAERVLQSIPKKDGSETEQKTV
jgi:hypothetical protein